MSFKTRESPEIYQKLKNYVKHTSEFFMLKIIDILFAFNWTNKMNFYVSSSFNLLLLMSYKIKSKDPGNRNSFPKNEFGKEQANECFHIPAVSCGFFLFI